MGYGAICGWPSAALPILMSSETPLPSGPLTIDEASWVTSLICIGGFFGNQVFGWLANHYGRKIPIILTAIPQAVQSYDKYSNF